MIDKEKHIITLYQFLNHPNGYEYLKNIFGFIMHDAFVCTTNKEIVLRDKDYKGEFIIIDRGLLAGCIYRRWSRFD